MTTLLHLLSANPILEHIASFLPFADLLRLSRVGSSYRAVLHGFPPVYDLEDGSKNHRVRKSLRVGYHNTGLWRQLKSVVAYECSWPGHKKGDNVLGCRMCSTPICEACIVKDSFKRSACATKGSAFDNRRRKMCRTCWKSGNPLTESLRYGPGLQVVNYALLAPCRCTAKDGVLCGSCKEEQNCDLKWKLDQCAGYGCGVPLGEAASFPYACIWCSGVLWGAMGADPVYANLKAVHDHLTRNPEIPRLEPLSSFLPILPKMTYADQRVPVARWSTPSVLAKQCADRRNATHR